MECPYQRFDEVKQVFYDCGKCKACRVNAREEWSVRLTHEWKYWNESCFITLTYEDTKLPCNCSLRKLDLTNFFHYVRDDERLKGREIKYFACGEYGDEGGIVQEGEFKGHFIHRPHYHAIIFGLDAFNDDDRKIISDNWHFCPEWMFYKKLGSHGEWLDGQAIDYVTADDINYVCGYTMKKLFGKDLEELIKSGKTNPFAINSQGLGKRYCFDNKKQILDLMYVQRKGHKLPIPRQYMKWLGIDKEVLRAPYKNAYNERHKNVKDRIKGYDFNYDKIYARAVEALENKMPFNENQIFSPSYRKAAEHLFQRAFQNEIEKQAELFWRSEK